MDKALGKKKVDFNSHARVGRDATAAIGALAATADFNSHARVGRDGHPPGGAETGADFNSHARVGRDYGAVGAIGSYRISTHTPV